MPNRKHSLPKSITISHGKYQVKIYSKKDKVMYNVGVKNTLEEAIKLRDEWIVSNYEKVEGYLPRGISISKVGKPYRAQLSFKDKNNMIGSYVKLLGCFDTLQEAIDYRTKFILGLL